MKRESLRRVIAALLAVLLGCFANFIGDRLLGVRIELFWGLDTFNFIWFLQLFILPVFVGIVVAYIYGLGGKWFAATDRPLYCLL